MPEDRQANNVDLAANLTVAWLNNPNVRANTDEAATFLKSMHETLSSFSVPEPAPAAPPAPSRERASTAAANGGAAAGSDPAVSIRKSLGSRNHIISLIDGKPYRALKRHLTKHGLTPDQYRERYGLKPDYPMVAPAYAEKRSELAKKIGLGRKPAESRKRAADPKPAGRKRGRPRKAV